MNMLKLILALFITEKIGKKIMPMNGNWLNKLSYMHVLKHYARFKTLVFYILICNNPDDK